MPLKAHSPNLVEPTRKDHARFFRPATISNVEVLHATFYRHRYPQHAHDVLTVALVDKGRARFEVEGRVYTAGAGSVFLIPAQAVHTGEPVSSEGYRYRVLYFDPTDIVETWRSAAQRMSPFRASTILPCSAALRPALLQWHGFLEDEQSSLEQSEALLSVAIELARTFEAEPLAVQGKPLHPAVSRAREYLHEHWNRNVTIDELAHQSGLSSYHLIRLFHAQIGLPPSAYRRVLRIDEARKLLRHGEPPAGVALDCGFFDQAHLTRHFTRMVGVSPQRYAAASS